MAFISSGNGTGIVTPNVTPGQLARGSLGNPGKRSLVPRKDTLPKLPVNAHGSAYGVQRTRAWGVERNNTPMSRVEESMVIKYVEENNE